MKKLTTADLEALVPSAFSRTQASSVSEKYKMVDTSEVITHLVDMGWTPTKAGETSTKLEARAGTQYHTINFQHPDFKIGKDNIEVIITNSNNAENSFRIIMGIYRLVCSNGLVIGDDVVEPIKLTHIGNIKEQVTEAVATIKAKTEEIISIVDMMKTTKITQAQKDILVETAFKFRSKKDITDEQKTEMLTVNRPEDNYDNIWETFNVIQENVVNGNLHYKMKKSGKIDKVTGLPTITYADYKYPVVKDNKKLIKLNQTLFSAVSEMVSA